MSNNFSWSEFLSFQSYTDQYNYAIKNLDILGSGTGRTAFDLSPTRVLKMVKLNSSDDIISSGLQQNKEEIKISAEFPLITPKILKASSNSYWMIVEKVKEIQTIEEFQKLSNGISFVLFSFGIMIFDHLRSEVDQEAVETEMKRKLGYYPYMSIGYETEEEMQEAINKLLNNKFFRQLLAAVSKHEIMSGDLTKLNSWGFAQETKRITVLDIGLTRTSYKVYKNDINMGFLDEEEEADKNSLFEFLVYS